MAVTKTDLVNQLASELNVTKKLAGQAVDSLLSNIKEALAKGDDVQLVGFGSFSTTQRAARTGRNPQTGVSINIPAKTVPKFKAGKALKDAIG
jgi:DNA-binding protein HU-beta